MYELWIDGEYYGEGTYDRVINTLVEMELICIFNAGYVLDESVKIIEKGIDK